jgi:hypothetical protein
MSSSSSQVCWCWTECSIELTTRSLFYQGDTIIEQLIQSPRIDGHFEMTSNKRQPDTTQYMYIYTNISFIVDNQTLQTQRNTCTSILIYHLLWKIFTKCLSHYEDIRCMDVGAKIQSLDTNLLKLMDIRIN